MENLHIKSIAIVSHNRGMMGLISITTEASLYVTLTETTIKIYSQPTRRMLSTELSVRKTVLYSDVACIHSLFVQQLAGDN